MPTRSAPTPTKIPRARPALAPPDMPSDEPAEAAAEIVAEAEAARVPAALARLGVGGLVATMRVLCCALSLADEGLIDGLITLSAGLLVDFVSPLLVALVVLGGNGRCAGGPRVILAGPLSSSGPTKVTGTV
jgi:hypothetical protein